jgi:hypothetical protein
VRERALQISRKFKSANLFIINYVVVEAYEYGNEQNRKMGMEQMHLAAMYLYEDERKA